MNTVDIDLSTNAVQVVLDRIETDLAPHRPTIDLDLDRVEAEAVLNLIDTIVSVEMPSVDIGVPGITGPRGPAGSAGGYRHTQTSPSASWVVAHNLDRHPAVTIVLTSEGWVTSDIDYIDDNTLTIVFPAAVTGTADM